MALLDQITQMRNQGYTDEQIVGGLQQQGISPQEITDALSQSQIKNAVAGEYAPQEAYAQPAGGYDQQAYAPQDAYTGQQGYDQGGYGAYPQQGGASTDTTIEVAEQVFSEKIKKTEKQIREFSEFKTLTQTKIDNFDERLKRIEKTIDTLQIKILEKIGSYGEDIAGTKKEMQMMRDSFGKIINPLAEKAETRKTPSKKK